MSTATIKAAPDLDAWRDDRVPKDVEQAVMFIYFRHAIQSTTKTKGPSWDEIAKFMGWNCPRAELRKKMKRLRRWGVKWDMNKPGSTRIHKDVEPFLSQRLERARLSA